MTEKHYPPPPAPLPQAELIDVNSVLQSYLNKQINLITILGPTASGKTRYAVNFAREINKILGGKFAEIISADSRQVYRGMDIGSGKDISEYQEIPYHLIDIVPAGYRYNIFEYQHDFIRAYEDIISRGCIPILCGGSGLYIKAVVEEYFTKHNDFKAYYIGTLVDRDERNRLIDIRLDKRLAEGMIDEVKSLLSTGVDEDALIHYGLEYKYVTLYLRGDLSYEQMREELAIAIHQFAKRQMTWFRGIERRGDVIHWTRP